jgi:hypothetical protein
VQREELLDRAKVVRCEDCRRVDEDLAATQRELERARRRPHEQQQMPGVETERPSGMRAARKGRR